eukprot:TRINITY_DN11537_c0_g1_i1.p1 TRINITY_DN11537_c0_g1~~TRINITY_DN11537_c0_g1_i1.p1  ORF type:complete len:344 (-),score=46.90 TRINITY_DN11537_c0_g1_i1:12-1043(-)
MVTIDEEMEFPAASYDDACCLPVEEAKEAEIECTESEEIFESVLIFQPKFNNHAKGNFFISPEKIKEMIENCSEDFTTNNQEEADEGLAFSTFKESVAMSINDGQIIIRNTKKGLMIPINIDLHFKQDREQTMYLVAVENEVSFRHKVRWCIKEFMTADQIYDEYGVRQCDLPQSSRNMQWFQDALKMPPINVSPSIINKTPFQDLPQKKSKKSAASKRRIKMAINELRDAIYYSWWDHRAVPVVVIKGKKQWVEWKKFIAVYDHNGEQQWIAISLRYYAANRQWKIECMDYDHGRMFYQHRLVGLASNDPYCYSYKTLENCITASLDLPKRNRKCKNRRYNN